MRAVIEEIVDDGELFEVHEAWARNVLCVLARLDGAVVGIVAGSSRIDGETGSATPAVALTIGPLRALLAGQ
jgi:acetyl-CoA carboxylase carboxyltransferase component